MMGWIADTRRIIDSTTYNCFIGTNETGNEDNDEIPGYKQERTITAVEGQNDALTIAVDLANLLVDLKDVSRDYNDYGFIRSYDESDLIVVFNAKLWNQLKKADLPVIFHKEGLLDEFEKVVLPARYFGTLIPGATHAYTEVPNDGATYRALVELYDEDGNHYFAGDALKADTRVYADEMYKEDETIAYKVIHKRSAPYMSAFSVSTSFFNAKNLSTNYYLTFGRNKLEHLKNFPFITARFNG